jgi:CHAD domain-containing protein
MSASSRNPRLAQAVGRNGAWLPPNTLELLTGSLKKRWKLCRRGLKRCQKNLSRKTVHDSRVQTRRLLSLLELLTNFVPPDAARKLQTALKQHLASVNDLRDLQVQTRATKDLLKEFPAAEPFLDYLERRKRRFARRSRRRVDRLRLKRLGRLASSCRSEVRRRGQHDRPEANNTLLLRAVGSAFFRAAELREPIGSADIRSIHRFRVAFKKLRYLLEAVAKHLPSASSKTLTEMRRHQSRMGAIQDAHVLLARLDKFVCHEERQPRWVRSFRGSLVERRASLVGAFLRDVPELPNSRPILERISRAPGRAAASNIEFSGLRQLPATASKTQSV